MPYDEQKPIVPGQCGPPLPINVACRKSVRAFYKNKTVIAKVYKHDDCG